MATLARTSNAAVIADGDTGYGGLLNVHHTVRAFERAGVAGLMLEDQVWPKRCGHMKGKSCISAEEMVQKIKAACDARRDVRARAAGAGRVRAADIRMVELADLLGEAHPPQQIVDVHRGS